VKWDDEHYLEHLRFGNQRSKLVDKIYNTFANILGLDDLPNEPTAMSFSQVRR
jgi:hypothetical protein